MLTARAWAAMVSVAVLLAALLAVPVTQAFVVVAASTRVSGELWRGWRVE